MKLHKGLENGFAKRCINFYKDLECFELHLQKQLVLEMKLNFDAEVFAFSQESWFENR